jgi:hypothetical protein
MHPRLHPPGLRKGMDMKFNSDIQMIDLVKLVFVRIKIVKKSRTRKSNLKSKTRYRRGFERFFGRTGRREKKLHSFHITLFYFINCYDYQIIVKIFSLQLHLLICIFC